MYKAEVGTPPPQAANLIDLEQPFAADWTLVAWLLTLKCNYPAGEVTTHATWPQSRQFSSSWGSLWQNVPPPSPLLAPCFLSLCCQHCPLNTKVCWFRLWFFKTTSWNIETQRFHNSGSVKVRLFIRRKIPEETNVFGLPQQTDSKINQLNDIK